MLPFKPMSAFAFVDPHRRRGLCSAVSTSRAGWLRVTEQEVTAAKLLLG